MRVLSQRAGRFVRMLRITITVLLVFAASGLTMADPVAASIRRCSGEAQPQENVSYGQLGGIAVISQCEAWAVGYWLVGAAGNAAVAQRWNGRAWRSVAVPIPAGAAGSELYGVAAISAKDVWAVGEYAPGSGGAATLIEHWDGKAWSQVPSPNAPCAGCADPESGLSAVDAVAANDVWALGSPIEHWNGTAWSIVPFPSHSSWELTAIAAVSSADAWVVGSYIAPYKCCDRARTLIVHWNGHAWQKVPSPNAGGAGFNDNALYGVSAASARNIWAVGSFYNARQGRPLTLTEHWDGKSWTLVASPDPSGAGFADQLHGVVVTQSGAWAAGEKVNGGARRP